MQIETIGTATLYRADCRDVLPGIRGDAVITDPVWPNAPEGMFDVEDPKALLREALELCESAKRLAIIMRYDSDPRFLGAVPAEWPFARVSPLEYAIPAKTGRTLGGMEIAYCYGQYIRSRKGRHLVSGRLRYEDAPRYAQPRRGGSVHPCSRPQEFLDWLVNWWSDPGETVVDPFMGEGTTGAAAVAIGRPFIGIEIKQEYFDAACRKIEQRLRHQTEPLFAESR